MSAAASATAAGRVPAQSRSRQSSKQLEAGPAPAWEAGDALTLSDRMRGRLRAAVGELLADPELEAAPDAVRLAAVVLLAKSNAAELSAQVTVGELGRWLGLSGSQVSHVVRPRLQRGPVWSEDVCASGSRRTATIRWQVARLVWARHHGRADHPLRLTRPELATLLRLCEALFAPGWTETPPGLLAARRGHGAATDRLGLLLAVLNARADGTVRLCAGAVDARGRLAATMARLLGCDTAAGARALARLEACEALEVPSGARERLVVPAVAAAHRQMRAAARAAGRAPVKPRSGRSGTSVAGEATAGGDQIPPQAANPQVEAGFGGDCSEGASAPLHTDHSPVAEVVEEGSGGSGFSGEGRMGTRGRLECAGVREDQDHAQAVDGAHRGPLAVVDGEGDALRAEKPKKSSPAAEKKPADVSGGPLRAARLPSDARLQVALAPVAVLWAQLNGGQRRLVRRAAVKQIGALSSIVSSEAAPQLLADRLADRLAEAGGEALVRDATGWLLGRGLVQRVACTDYRCDDGIRLDTGGDCPTCGNIVHFRRAQWARIAAEVDQQLPGAAPGERKAVLEERLNREAALDAEDWAWRHEQAQIEQARQDAARKETEARAAEERAAAQAAEAARQAQPCADCGAAQSAGLCETCTTVRVTRDLVEDAVLLAAAGAADIADADDIAAVAAHVRTTMDREMAAARAEFLDLLGDEAQHSTPQQLASALAYTDHHVTEQAIGDYRRTALAFLARSPEADAEAARAHAAELRRFWWHSEGEAAHTSAAEAAEAARGRAAEHLLAQRLQQLHTVRAGSPSTATSPVTRQPGRRGEWLAELAARPLPGEKEAV